MSVDSHLIHTCSIERSRSTTDSYKAEQLLWPPDIPPHLVEVPCRLVIKEQRVGDSAFAERPVITTYRLLLAAGVDVRQRDRITTIRDEEGLVDAGPFRVEEVMKRRARTVRHISLLLERQG